jgi:hypothetical protein
MAFKDKYTTSVHGRRLGLQAMSTPETGSGNGRHDFLVGAEDIRVAHSTADSTSTNLKPFGVSVLTTAVSSGVYTIDPPIPGVTKRLVFHTTGANPIYVKTANGEFINSTQGTTMSVITSSQTAYASVTLCPISTGAWAVLGSVSSAYLRTSTST